jgi:hypothetical protein
MKFELKIDYKETDKLEELIKSSYFLNNNGKLKPGGILSIYPDDEVYHIFKGLNNILIKVMNDEIIEGPMKFVVEESNDVVNLHPCSVYCIIEDGKYSFY